MKQIVENKAYFLLDLLFDIASLLIHGSSPTIWSLKKHRRKLPKKFEVFFDSITPGRSSLGGKTIPVSPQVCRPSGLSAEAKFLVPDLGIYSYPTRVAFLHLS